MGPPGRRSGAGAGSWHRGRPMAWPGRRRPRAPGRRRRRHRPSLGRQSRSATGHEPRSPSPCHSIRLRRPDPLASLAQTAPSVPWLTGAVLGLRPSAVLEPELYGPAAASRGNGAARDAAQGALKAASPSATVPGWARRACKRVRPSVPSPVPTVATCAETPADLALQVGAAPCWSRSGPSSAPCLSSALCASVQCGGRPGMGWPTARPPAGVAAQQPVAQAGSQPASAMGA